MERESLLASSWDRNTTQDMECFILRSSKGFAETAKLNARTVRIVHEFADNSLPMALGLL